MLITVKDIIDILLVAILLYQTYQLLRHSGAVNLFWGIFIFVILWYLVTYIFQLELTGTIFRFIGSAGAIAIVIIFQEEIRSFFYRIGSHVGFSQIWRRFARKNTDKKSSIQIEQIVQACQNMSASKTGALIVIAQKQDLRTYIDSGERMDALISARMIENVFFKNTPLHDGALIITNNRLTSAACILPVSRNLDIPKHYGLRHRAGLGLSEKTDAVSIIVSEETGHISVARDAKISKCSITELQTLLIEIL